MSSLTITNEDIEYASALLNIADGFNEPRVEAIKCMRSRDIVACPGSGKTTILLAKLIILSRQLPLENNKGICILTHTNVAIDEIKERLGDKAGELMAYPNFVGTLHSFISKYVATPAAIKYYSTRISKILEDDEYKIRLSKKYNSLFPPFSGSKLDAFLYSKIDEEIKTSKNYDQINKAKQQKLWSLELDYTDDIIKEVSYDRRTNILRNPDLDSYKEYIRLIEGLIQEGIASFNDIQGLALKYAIQFGDQLKNIFSERFSFVFVDEMQDTSQLQLKILNELFDKDKVVFQCFGDPQQTIYESEDCNCAWQPIDPIFILNSNRMSRKIAAVADYVAVTPYKMIGRNSSQNAELAPIIITYKKDNVSHVLEAYAQIIKKFALDKSNKPIFKAVGMVKTRNDEKLSIKSYFPEYTRIPMQTKISKEFSDLQSFLVKIDENIIRKEGVQVYYNRFILVFLKILRLNDIKTEEGKYYSKTNFLRFLREKDDDLFKFTYRFFAKAILRIETGKPIVKHFKYVIFIVLSRLFNFQINLKSNEFLQVMTISTPIDEKVLVKENTYVFHDLNIELDSVHGVKGQTHTATLYLETVYHSKTVESIIEYLTGGSKKKLELEAYEEKHIKVAYVAMTRPTELLCITMDNEVYLNNFEKLSNLGWVHYTEVLQT